MPLDPVGSGNLYIEGTPSDGNLYIGGQTSDDSRSITINATTGGAVSSVVISSVSMSSIYATTPKPTAQIEINYDPNLLSDINSIKQDKWHIAENTGIKVSSYWKQSDSLPVVSYDRFKIAELSLTKIPDFWRESDFLSESAIGAWKSADLLAGKAAIEAWRASEHVDQYVKQSFREALGASQYVSTSFMEYLPVADFLAIQAFSQGDSLSIRIIERFGQGELIQSIQINKWSQAGYPGNAINPGPAENQKPPITWNADLYIACPNTHGNLYIGTPSCSSIALSTIQTKRTYVANNTARLVRLPDRTEIPVTSMTIKTDANSWCWGLSASISGSNAWSLVQPYPSGYPIEVEATINDWVWTFVLDYPGLSVKFNNNNLSVDGRSTSAWLDEPWTPRTTGRQAYPRTANQLAEEAIQNTGWTLVWLIDDWLVPGGRFEWDNSIAGRVMRIIKPIDGCLYTDPSQKILTAYPRYKKASWLWDAEIADLELPGAILSTLARKPVITPLYNGVYVSGTDSGVLAFVKIDGTDGSLQPGQPIVEALCCDSEGIAARTRGLAFLSANGGTGYSLSIKTLLGRYGYTSQMLPPLLTPEYMLKIDGKNGVVRSISVNASRSGGWTGVLNVSQTAEVEFWEVES